MAKNLFKVPLKQWTAWSGEARVTFNRVYDFVYNNQTLCVHPKAPKIEPEFWKTTAWNVAWTAADAIDNSLPEIVKDISCSGKVLKVHHVN